MPTAAVPRRSRPPPAPPAAGGPGPGHAAPGAGRRSRSRSPSASALALDESTPADPGSARVGQDLHGRADGPGARRRRAQGRRHREQPQGDRPPPRRDRERGRRARADGPDRAEDRQTTASRPARSARALQDQRASCSRPFSGGELDVVGGTAWVWSREDFAGTLDVLVVDEAGQIALANAIAVSPAARSLVLLGDPQQLDQPLKGTHPPGAERSALAHLLDGAATMPADEGPLPGQDLAPPSGRLRVHVRGLLRGPPRAAGRARAPGVSRARRPSRGRASATSPVDAQRQPERIARGGGRDRGPRAAPWSMATTGGRTDDGERQRVGLERRPDRRALQRPGRARSRAGCPRAPASAPWTSSRARRRPSRSTRWRRPPPRTRREGWSSSTASTGSTSRPRAPAA